VWWYVRKEEGDGKGCRRSEDQDRDFKKETTKGVPRCEEEVESKEEKDNRWTKRQGNKDWHKTKVAIEL